MSTGFQSPLDKRRGSHQDLGDNIFYGHGLADILQKAAAQKDGATIFAYEVSDPERYGVVAFDGTERATSLEEKPQVPKSRWAVTDIYFYDNAVVEAVKQVKPSHRGELEITTLNELYLDAGKLVVERLGRGFAWLDTGTFASLLDASEYVTTLERRQGHKTSCPEEIALRLGYITPEDIAPWLDRLGKSAYATYLRDVATSLANPRN